MSDAPPAAPAVTGYGQRHVNAPRQLDAFSFLIGKWEGTGRVKLPDEKTAEFTVSWIGRYILDGMAIADEFHSSQPDGSPYLGISFRHYDANAQYWIVEYLNVSHSFLRPQVNAASGSVTVEGSDVVVISQSPDAWSRETYRVGRHNTFTYTIDMSNDAGRTWNVGHIEMSFMRKE